MKKGARVNLEQPLTAGKELGGHFVLGHVDTVGHVANLQREGEGWIYSVSVPEDFAQYLVPKGSITIDGISLTVAAWHAFVTPLKRVSTVQIAVIPYTYEHTNIRDRKPGDAVNLEGDVLGKYVERYIGARTAATGETSPEITVARLAEQGF